MLALLVAVQLAAAPPLSRADVLKLWVQAAEEHRPGGFDAAAGRVRELRARDLELVIEDLRAMLRLIADPRTTAFYPRQENRAANRARPIVYPANHLAVLRELARQAAALGDGNRLLKRGAVLHTDLALFAGPDSGRAAGAVLSPLERTQVFVDDGQQVGLISAVDHWTVARRMLDEVSSRQNLDDPDPHRHEDVRLWYRATATLLLGNHRVSLSHFADAVRLFPRDPDILFLAGSHREMASAPGVYQTLKRARGPGGPVVDLESQAGELRLAESFFKRALAVKPLHAEARLRLGRVLARLGQPEAAARELGMVVASTTDPLLLYYGHLFLGSVLDARRDTAGARAAYERAAAIAPDAQSPVLALSQLLARAGDRAAALTSLTPTLEPAAVDALDPFWDYHVAVGRDAANLMRTMYQTLTPVPGQ